MQPTLHPNPTADPRQKVYPVQPLTPLHQSCLRPMLMRLEAALGDTDIARKMVLVPKAKLPSLGGDSALQTLHLIVGYSGSAKSQAALDTALLMAHQTRLVKPNSVIVHVVYVIDETRPQTVENADRILWQARCLANEWRGSLNAHLRIGDVATELSQVAVELEAEFLLVGCHTPTHPLVQHLTHQTPCSVLGLPT